MTEQEAIQIIAVNAMMAGIMNQIVSLIQFRKDLNCMENDFILDEFTKACNYIKKNSPGLKKPVDKLFGNFRNSIMKKYFRHMWE